MRRPAGVPADASWDDGDKEWVSAPLDEEGRKHGLVRYYRAAGSLCCETEFVEDVPHGSFRRFHENGEVSREGSFESGVLEGLNTFYRSSGETTEKFPDGVPEGVFRCEMDYSEGEIVGGRLYDEDGELMSSHGGDDDDGDSDDDEPEEDAEEEAPPERAAGVPTTAIWSAEQERWEAGPVDALGQKHGEWKDWDREGRHVFTGRFEKDWPVDLKAFHEDGALASHETYRIEGVPIRRVLHRGADGSGIPEDIAEEVATVEYNYDAHGYMTDFRFLSASGALIEKTELYNDSSNRFEQARYTSLEQASQRWREEGAAFKRELNAWLDVIYKEGRENDEPEPQDERGDMERAVLEAIERLNKEGAHDKLRKLFPPAFEPLASTFFDKFGRNVSSILALSHDTFSVRVGEEIYFVDGTQVTQETGVLAVGASPDKQHYAIAFADRVEVRAAWNGPATAKLAYPKVYNTEAQRARPGLRTPQLSDPRRMGITALHVLPQGKRVILVSAEGIYALSAEGAQLLFPDREKLEQYLEEAAEGEVSLGIRFANAAVDPRGRYVSCGGMLHRGIFADLLVYELGPKGLGWKASSGAQAFFPRWACFHPKHPTVAYAAVLYAFFSNMGDHMPNTTFRLSLEQLAAGGAIEEFDGGVHQGLGMVECIYPFGDGFLLGMSNGYLWHMSATENVTQLGYLHLGGAIRAIDLSPDGKSLFVGGSTGMVVQLRLGGERDPNLITDMPVTDVGRWLFWRTFPPMRW